MIRAATGVSNMNDVIYSLSIGEVCASARAPAETIITIVEHGIVEPKGHVPEEWLFEPFMLMRVRKALRMQRDLELEWAAIALALDLLEQLKEARADNRRLRQQLDQLLAG